MQQLQEVVLNVSVWIDHLEEVFGPPRQPVDVEELRAVYQDAGLSGLVRVMKRQLGITCKLRLGKVNSGVDIGTPAFIKVPDVVPLYASREFQQLKVTLYVQRSFVARAQLESIVSLIAHEFAHILLNASRSKYRKEEKVADLTAMYLGYTEVFTAGKIVRTYEAAPTKDTDGVLGVTGQRYWNTFRGMFDSEERVLGYLTEAELSTALSAIRSKR